MRLEFDGAGAIAVVEVSSMIASTKIVVDLVEATSAVVQKVLRFFTKFEACWLGVQDAAVRTYQR